MQLTGLAPRAALRAVRQALEQADVPDAAFDARELYRLAVGKDPRLDISPLTAEEAASLAALTARRAGREPLQYIAGQWDFLDFTLAVGPGVLCPRADTEVVCEAAVKLLQASGNPTPTVLDLCAGTGCLGLGIKRFVPGARVTCWEKSPEALAYLRRNARQALPGAEVAVREGDVLTDWQTLPPESADLIVSNPPYLTGAEMQALMPETAREPAMALDGGADGLVFYRCLTGPWKQILRPGGWLVLEIGYEQREAVLALGAENGWVNGSCRQDYGGNDRAVLLQKPRNRE
ncbi:peptide chain release factor N(5)-glutamine methyltransferase [Gemmiger formicilis]|nr:peptide chain release factor N(5)-glutamine methyltransferase [Gemmiger formicilis]MBM6716889.1 peptide chain release factor N(5)-glutamine methyltransferase [Gemmiger formicilis]